MSLSVKNLGWWGAAGEYSTRPQKVVLPTTDGKTIIVVPEYNNATAFAANNAYGDGTGTDKILVYEVSADFATITLRASVTSGNLEQPMICLSADLYSDNSIGIAWRRNSGAICFTKVTTGTWAVSAVDTISTPASTPYALDITLSDGDVPAVGWVQTNGSNPKCEAVMFVKKTVSPSWVESRRQTLTTTAAPNSDMESISLQWVKGIGSASARTLIYSVGSAELAGADLGVRVYSGIVDETTGTMVNATLRDTLLAGNMTTKWGRAVRKSYLFPSANGEITLALTEAADKKNLLVTRYTWNGSAWARIMEPQISTASERNINKANGFAASYANNTVNFYFMAEKSGAYTPVNYVAVIDTVENSVRYSGEFNFDNLENGAQDRWYPMAGTGRNASINLTHRVLFFGKNNSDLYHARVHRVVPAPAPTSVTPASGIIATSGKPLLSLRAALGKKYPQSKHKAVWQIASDAGFTTAVRTYTQPDSKLVTINNTDGGDYIYISDTLPESLALTTGDWYIRAALVDEFGTVGTWSLGQIFTISHPPAAVDLSPNAGQVLVGGNITFNWRFTDPSPIDTQTAYQIIVERNDTGAVILDTGKVPSTTPGHIALIDNTYTGVLLRWMIRLWDADDAPGEYSEYETFAVAAPPTVVIDAPGAGSTVTSGTPTVLFTPTVGDGRRIKKIQVTLSQGGTIVRDSGSVPVDVASGTQISWRVPLPLLDNHESYVVQVIVTDNTGMTGVSATRTFTVEVVPPASASGLVLDGSGYNVEGEGYISVFWNDDNRDADFESWIVSRKSDLIDMSESVVEEGEWEIVDEVTATAPSYEYRDYYAPSGYKVNYRVQQMVNRSGDRAVSESDPTDYAMPRSEGYWIIQPTSEDGSIYTFRLHNVVGDDYTDEVEEAEYVVIGRGRHVDQGDEIGVKGSLSAQIRDGNGTSARQKKLELENARKLGSAVHLRNPFGDVWLVNIGNINVSRVAGVGKSEFVDVTVPYSEVYASDD